MCKFYVVDHSMVIIGINDSEKLKLFNVNFDAIDKASVKVVHNVDVTAESERFKCQSWSTQNYLKVKVA